MQLSWTLEPLASVPVSGHVITHIQVRPRGPQSEQRQALPLVLALSVIHHRPARRQRP